MQAEGNLCQTARLTGVCLLILAACNSAPLLSASNTPAAPRTDAAAASPTPNPSVEPPLTEQLASYMSGLEANLSFTGSVLVARRGEILLNRGYGFADRQKQIRNAADTTFRIASITKQFTATAILLLQARGKLNVQDRACNYLPTCPPGWRTITLHQLLTHTSGIPSYKDLEGYPAFRATPAAPSDLMNTFSDLPLAFAPGSQYSYSNSGYVVLGRIIETVAGTTFEGFVEDNILAPLGMSDAGVLDLPANLALGYANSFDLQPAATSDPSVEYAAGGLYSTAEDLYRFDRALFSGDLLPPALLDRMVTAYEFIPDSGGLSYGYGCQVKDMDGHRLVGHSGLLEGYSAMNMYFPDDQVAVILLENQRNPSPYGIGIQLAEMVLKPSD